MYEIKNMKKKGEKFYINNKKLNIKKRNTASKIVKE